MESFSLVFLLFSVMIGQIERIKLINYIVKKKICKYYFLIDKEIVCRYYNDA